MTSCCLNKRSSWSALLSKQGDHSKGLEEPSDPKPDRTGATDMRRSDRGASPLLLPAHSTA
jgi:hypothetical protein